MGNLFTGLSFVFRGLSLVTQPGVKRYVLIPLMINIGLFATLLVLAIDQFEILITWLNGFLPSWLSWLEWLLWPLFAISAVVILFFSFSIVANIVAAPFNGLLAEAVELHLTGRRPSNHSSFASLIADIIPSIINELRKLLYFIVRALPIALLFLIPGVNLIAPAVWLLFSAWMLAFEYGDYAMGNHNLGFPRQRQLLGEHRLQSIGFGGGVLAATMIPLVNFLVMPVAVAGATAFWVEQLSGSKQR